MQREALHGKLSGQKVAFIGAFALPVSEGHLLVEGITSGTHYCRTVLLPASTDEPVDVLDEVEKVGNAVPSIAAAAIIIRRTEEPTHHRWGHMMGINFHRQISASPNVQDAQRRRRRMLTPGNWQVKFHAHPMVLWNLGTETAVPRTATSGAADSMPVSPFSKWKIVILKHMTHLSGPQFYPAGGEKSIFACRCFCCFNDFPKLG
uniref:Uncharacterized protein n=1 Tax=Trichuris muris TaxID=70415 RepID=A0A5S6QDF2_TRIMR